MAAPSKRRKIYSEDDDRGDSELHAASSPDVLVYLVPQRIQNKRLSILRARSAEKKLPLSDEFRREVTHVVTECQSIDEVLRVQKRDRDDWRDDVQVLSAAWLSECIAKGRLVPVRMVREEHRLKWENKSQQSTRECAEPMPEYACQRITPLKHHNHKLTDALETLEKEADFRNDKENYSRALAFRNASCALKNLPFTVTSVSQINTLPHVGGHCVRVIKDILENGFSSEVHDIETSSWFQTMKLFTAIFGVGPATAQKWFKMGLRRLEDVRSSPDVSVKDDDRINTGLAFYEELNLPVKRPEATALLELVTEEAEKISPGTTVTLCGGFRRGKEQGHDIDLILSHPDEGVEKDILKLLLRQLDQRDLIVHGKWEGGSFHEDALKSSTKSNLKTTMDHFEKWMGVLKLDRRYHGDDSGNANVANDTTQGGLDYASGGVPAVPRGAVSAAPKEDDEAEVFSTAQATRDEDAATFRPKLEPRSSVTAVEALARSTRKWNARRVDLIVVPAGQYYYALVGWTGNRLFNRSMRLYAERVLNMKLTSHGLYDFKKRESVPAASEKEVFDNMKLTYLEPWQRNG